MLNGFLCFHLVSVMIYGITSFFYIYIFILMSACEPCGFYHVLMGFELSRYAWFLAWSSIHFQTSILVFMSCFFFEDLIEIHFQYIPPPKHIGSRFTMYGFRFHSSTSCSVFSIFPCCCTCSWDALFYLIFSSSLPMGTKGYQRHILSR